MTPEKKIWYLKPRNEQSLDTLHHIHDKQKQIKTMDYMLRGEQCASLQVPVPGSLHHFLAPKQ